MAVVYIHKKNDTGEIFYVGIGKEEKRAYRKDSRTKHWENVVKKHGLIIEIIHKDITWEQACKIEKELIKFYGRLDLNTGILINLTEGGEGNSNPFRSEEWKRKQREAKIGEKNSNYKKPNLQLIELNKSRKGQKRPFKKRNPRPDVSERNKKNHPTLGKKRSDAKERLNKTLICPHCGKEDKVLTMYRLHFDKCKFK
jgi:hypothetical protein